MPLDETFRRSIHENILVQITVYDTAPMESLTIQVFGASETILWTLSFFVFENVYDILGTVSFW